MQRSFDANFRKIVTSQAVLDHLEDLCVVKKKRDLLYTASTIPFEPATDFMR